MVLNVIFSLLACVKQPTYDATISTSSVVTGLPTVAVLELENKIVPVPKTLQDRLSTQLQMRDISLQFYDHSDQFTDIKEGRHRLDLYTQSQILLIEANAIYFAQVGGRFRWETNFDLYLKTSDGIREKHLKIPVFLLYHHQREAEALLEAEAVLYRELEQFLIESLERR